jgi:hypothetical protein
VIYRDLFRPLEKYQVRYLLAGGLAMNLHGVDGSRLVRAKDKHKTNVCGWAERSHDEPVT